MVLVVLYAVFCLSTALWALEVAQLIGLVDMLLSPDGLSTDALFNRFYDLIARETKVTGILFESQMVAGDILVIWRASAICFERRIVVLLPLFWWILMIVNILVHAARCQSGVATTDYGELCKVTDVAAPVLSILTNISVMFLVLWKAWELRETLRDVLYRRKTNKIFTLFVLMVESGTLYVAMLIADLLVTSIVTGGNETVGRMVDCISGYAAVQFVGIYPTLLIVVLRESVWNSATDSTGGVAISAIQFASQNAAAGSTLQSSSQVERGKGSSYKHVLGGAIGSRSRDVHEVVYLGDEENQLSGEKLGVAL
ncbi:uncharacterized protein PHACADRAFT_265383 [Phanerochaete carnosa HHB-10118-sp]|uniref:G-protein coupled receptors family 1 profile domain-containing protein n=1 Tax=Phanerochaete carnosa (strain HHB-10118-sp) TaxID=650164 RepID=K5VEZ6_PHACS|nr:uncharacterized protein PHACADRAFT_265383 [Phanerochaete carnosa HHB-10118-sp]EKM49733.1 hypothetical protein PHACADRAFT_265383 [Phanerochaete carnosa HHB-10118-sp]